MEQTKIKLLMVTPNSFRVSYAINPHMVDSSGNLNQVDSEEALRQWGALKLQFEAIGLEVDTLEGHEDYPDMVFCANQCLPALIDDHLHIVLSNMANEERRPEVAVFKEWASRCGLPVISLNAQPFEGCGDVIQNLWTGDFFGGYGFRTEKSVYTELESVLKKPILKLRLVNDSFYHLDTCLSILNQSTALYVPEAFDGEGRQLLKTKFEHLLETPPDEARIDLACNCFSPNGKDVVIQRSAVKTIELLRSSSFNPWPVDTSEFIKAGGSVFCLKQILPTE